MQDLKRLNLSDLPYLLIEQTTCHMQLIAGRATSERFIPSREILRSHQAEITLRKLVGNNNHSCFPS